MKKWVCIECGFTLEMMVNPQGRKCPSCGNLQVQWREETTFEVGDLIEAKLYGGTKLEGTILEVRKDTLRVSIIETNDEKYRRNTKINVSKSSSTKIGGLREMIVRRNQSIKTEVLRKLLGELLDIIIGEPTLIYVTPQGVAVMSSDEKLLKPFVKTWNEKMNKRRDERL